MDFSMLFVIEDHVASKKEKNKLSINMSEIQIADSRNKIGNQHIGIIDYL